MNFEKKICDDLICKGYSIVELSDDLYDSVLGIFSEGESFFSLTVEEKCKSSSPKLLEGYKSFGAEYSDIPDNPDLNESFSVWKRNSSSRLIAEWAVNNALHKSMRLVFADFTNLAHGVFEGLRMQINESGESVKESDLDYLQINYYEPAKQKREFLQQVHEDGHLLTITTSTKPGLEIMVNGKFEPVQLKENEVIFMPGSILTLLTGGIIQPLFHRVRCDHSVQVRKSLMFFVNLSLDHHQNTWLKNETNRGVDISKIALENSSRFGLPKFDTIPKNI